MGNCCFEFTPAVTSLEEHHNLQANNSPPPPSSSRQLHPEPIVCVSEQQQRPKSVHAEEIKLEAVIVEQPAEVKHEINESLEELVELHKQINHFYTNHNVDSCMPLIQKLQNITANLSKSIKSGSSLEQQLKEYCQLHSARLNHPQILNAETITQIKREHDDILHYEQQISGGNWEESSFQKGVRLSTRREEGSVGVLIEMELELPFEVLIAILIEMDLYSEFIPFNEISRQEKIFSRNCRIGYNLNNYPFLAKREAYFEGIGYSRLRTHGEIFLFTRSIHDKPELQRHLQYPVTINPKYVQLTYKYFVVKYRPLRPGRGQLIMALNADIGLNFLPNFILEFLAKDFAKEFVECVVDIGKNFKGSKWEQNVEKNPDLFLFFKQEIDQYLKHR